MEKVLVTGGAGFIGSHFTRRLLQDDSITKVTVLDALTYAGNRKNLQTALSSPKFTFVHGNILDRALTLQLMSEHDAVVHFAAESHVDRSLSDAGNFVSTNVLGTQTLLDCAWRTGIRKFLHASTDEVYGSLPSGSAMEYDQLRPTVPYSASKAASDMIATAYFHSYGVPVCVTRSSNNYGPCQYPEKIIPRFVTRLLQGEQVTVHGHGEHVRNWLHVEDNCQGVETVLRKGIPGEVYNLGGGTDLTTNELTTLLVRETGASTDAITYVPDRTANDIRYSINWKKAEALGFRPQRDFQEGLAETVEWYRQNPDWWPVPTAVGPAAV
ncbi:dTDP-glucose 4,6-dehydratase [Streptomyces rhizosphaerihabitans]|uniref:dTDP-glucose 4,6-dehydratase n=1 Tax=Streptomyces rhizosphaerihabitans TaxID=1266770 RepID=UPI0021C1F544|nr:dTDP-glucose 4,6-dehydratase [Streptomyces rhizosphaerihabitans]MCT9011313.1 dTDP-glucose 4,6-dehydratase [Streptomyces rhizosphaerihabitans]